MSDNVIIFICEMLLPLSMVIIGLIMWRFTPAMNHFIGYRTVLSMRNDATWYTVQRIFGKLAVISGTVMVVITAIAGSFMVALNVSEDTAAVVCITVTGVQVAAMLVDTAVTEKRLRQMFNKDGTPKAADKGEQH